jgi:hypothetical protein
LIFAGPGEMPHSCISSRSVGDPKITPIFENLRFGASIKQCSEEGKRELVDVH